MMKVPRVSVVIPVLNEAECLPRLYQELSSVCASLRDDYEFEFILVDDGSTDATERVLSGLRRADERVRYLLLSRNFGHQSALSAGLAHAAGDSVIMMDGDLQHPPQLIPRLLEQWRAGHEIVNTVRIDTENISAGKKLLSTWFYRVFNVLSAVRIEPGNADFRLMSRAALDVLKAMPERQRFLRGMVPWTGFSQARVEFTAPARWAGRSKYTFLRNLRFALEGLTGFSFYPLRAFTVVGALIAAVSLTSGITALVSLCMGQGQAAGWIAVLSGLFFLCGSQLAAMGILGEYMGRTLEQVKGRPLYVIRGDAGFTTPAERRGGIPAPHRPRAGAGAGSSWSLDAPAHRSSS
jgi:polyisoprenyl-phosphate glycosyltransferase